MHSRFSFSEPLTAFREQRLCLPELRLRFSQAAFASFGAAFTVFRELRLCLPELRLGLPRLRLCISELRLRRSRGAATEMVSKAQRHF